MELQTLGRKFPRPSRLLASSAGLGWSTMSAELRAHGAIEAPAIIPQHVEIGLVVYGNKDAMVRRTGSGFCSVLRRASAVLIMAIDMLLVREGNRLAAADPISLEALESLREKETVTAAIRPWM